MLINLGKGGDTFISQLHSTHADSVLRETFHRYPCVHGQTNFCEVCERRIDEDLNEIIVQDNEIPISEQNANSEVDEDEEEDVGVSMHNSGDNFIRGSITPRGNSILFDDIVSDRQHNRSLTPIQQRN